MRPRHLSPLVEVLEGINRGKPWRGCVATPPRHAKTETLLHAIPWLLRQHPDWTIGYASYNDSIALSKSRVALDLAERAGLQLRTRSLSEWRLKNGRGGVLASGIRGSWTGFGLDLLIIDDPVKDRVEAESEVMRERVWDGWDSTLGTRLEPGASVIVNMARWHHDDLTGRLVKKLGWPYLNLPALRHLADGTAQSLWPERWTLKDILLKKHEMTPYAFEGLYQGAPRPREGRVFNEPVFTTRLPFEHREAWGLDLSYAATTLANWSVLTKMLEHHGERQLPRYYVAKVRREQIQAPRFKDVVREEMKGRLWMRPRWYATGPEIGIADFFARDDGEGKPGIFIDIKPPIGDHFIRAQKYAGAWNDGRVLVYDPDFSLNPEDDKRPPESWVNTFVEEHASFTGAGEETDDQIDSAVGAFDQLYLDTPDTSEARREGQDPEPPRGQLVAHEDDEDDGRVGRRRW